VIGSHKSTSIIAPGLFRGLVLLLGLFLLGSCTNYNPSATQIEQAYQQNIPLHFPKPRVAADNILTSEKVRLGQHLFYDKRLSFNQTQSCASCHLIDRAFTDGKKTSQGSTGDFTPRNAPSTVNLAYTPVLTWANPLIKTLRFQALLPMFGTDPVELGMVDKEDLMLLRIASDEKYQSMFKLAFVEEAEPIQLATITKALEAFQKSIISGNSDYDKYVQGDEGAISDSAKRGLDQFLQEKMECFHCHGGFNFTLTEDFAGKVAPTVKFHNTGLYNIGSENRYTAVNPGLEEITLKSSDNGKFRAPTLRNIALTYPYMHDGSIACDSGLESDITACARNALGKVVDHYANGGRNCTDKDCTAQDNNNPRVSSFVPGFSYFSTERNDMIDFLMSLTDCSMLTNENYQNPWPVGALNNPDGNSNGAYSQLDSTHPCYGK
jgi:cytochrome c peroxidase